MVERQFYIKIWDRAVDGVERELLQKLKYLSGYFADCGIQTEILEQQDIVRLCNLVNNQMCIRDSSNMKPKLDNYIFREWVDAAIACQDDKSLKSTLTPIIGKLSDMRIVAAELDYLMYEPFKEFITMAFLLVGNIPLLYFLNKDWYDVLVNTGFGKGILAVCLLVLLISFAAVIRLTKPVEYKR